MKIVFDRLNFVVIVCIVLFERFLVFRIIVSGLFFSWFLVNML